jgi:hypothetical protein
MNERQLRDEAMTLYLAGTDQGTSAMRC